MRAHARRGRTCLHSRTRRREPPRCRTIVYLQATLHLPGYLPVSIWRYDRNLKPNLYFFLIRQYGGQLHFKMSFRRSYAKKSKSGLKLKYKRFNNTHKLGNLVFSYALELREYWTSIINLLSIRRSLRYKHTSHKINLILPTYLVPT